MSEALRPTSSGRTPTAAWTSSLRQQPQPTPARAGTSATASTPSLFSTAGSISTPSPSIPLTTTHSGGRLHHHHHTEGLENSAGYRLTWSNPTPYPPTSPPSMTLLPRSAHGCKEPQLHRNCTTRCPKCRPHKPHRNAPTKSLSDFPSPGRIPPRSTTATRSQRVPKTTTGMGGPQRHAPEGRNHTETPSHPSPLGH